MKNRSVLLTLIGGLLISQIATADPSTPQPLEGFYAGVSVGQARMDLSGTHEDVAPFTYRQDRIKRDYDEIIFGGHIGYGWYNGSRFKGIEFDVSQFADDINDRFVANISTSNPQQKSFNVTNKNKYQLSGLYGNQFDNGMLVYGRLGLAYTDIDVASTTQVVNNPTLEDGFYSGSVHDWIGAVAGAGFVYPLTDHWSVRGEYNYTTYLYGPEYDNDKEDGEITDYDFDDHRLLIGLTYHF